VVAEASADRPDPVRPDPVGDGADGSDLAGLGAENEDATGAGDDAVDARRAAASRRPGWPGDWVAPAPPTPVPHGRGGPQRIPRPTNARAGDPPPWVHLAPVDRRPSVADVRRALAELGPARASEREATGVTPRAAAVLAPLYDDAQGEAVVVLTRRTWWLSSHQGEVSFPGGRLEPGETPVAGALREAKEEVDLDPSSVEIVGELDHLGTVTSASFIVPLVGLLPGRPVTSPNPAEVDTVLHVPLAELLDPAIFREERWTFPGGADRRIFFFELVDDTLWGATAAMLRQLLGVVTGTLGRGDIAHD
jgi:8-oxo-dGTP pyrophosphatase MutT (NUDIX family)